MGEEASQQYPRQAHTGLVVSPRYFHDFYQAPVRPLGYSIIDSLILFNGTLYIVTEPHGRWPSLDEISAVTPFAEELYNNDLRFVSPEEAGTLIPPLAGR